jgi:peptidoglycan/LPS O-acetylase OafA/YrhL
VAVDFFFVLSGFVIAASYGERLKQGFSIRTFMFLRYARLWPLHAFVLAVFVLLELVFALLGDLHFIGGREPFGAGREWSTLPATLFLLQEYVHPGQKPWNAVSWSISVEVGLYLAGAFALRAFGKGGPWVALFAGLLAGAVLFMPVPQGADDILRGICGFGIGLALFEVWKTQQHRQFSAAQASFAEGALTLAMLLAVAWLPGRLTIDLLFAAAILVFAFERGIVSRQLMRPGFVWLGALSYSIYMVHGMVLGRSQDVLALVQSRTGWQLIDAKLGGGDQIVMPPLAILAFILFVLLATVGTAYLTWHFVEEPARRWSKRKAAAWGAAGAERRAPWK